MSYRERRKQKRKVYKTYISLSEKSYEALLRLEEREPDMYPSHIVGHALRFADQMGMFSYENRAPGSRSEEPKKYISVKETRAEEAKKNMEKYGAECVDGICTFDRYEVSPAGIIIKTPHSLGLSQIPSDEAAVRKLVLGKFVTVTQAAAAYDTQNTNPEFTPDKIIKPKKK
jgi:hypothetical protein